MAGESGVVGGTNFMEKLIGVCGTLCGLAPPPLLYRDLLTVRTEFRGSQEAVKGRRLPPPVPHVGLDSLCR